MSLRYYVKSVRSSRTDQGRTREITLSHLDDKNQAISPTLLGNEFVVVLRNDAETLAGAEDGDFVVADLKLEKAPDNSPQPPQG